MTQTIIAHITDLHIRKPGRLAYGRLNTAPYLAEAVKSIKNLRQKPDVVLMTGDLTDFGRAEEYEHLKALIADLGVPFYMLAGNHDDSRKISEFFGESCGECPSPDRLYYSFKAGSVRVIVLDTSVLGDSHGELDDCQLHWLDKILFASQNESVIVAMHHPPFKTLIGHMDKIGLKKGRDEFEKIISKHPQVERILCGHLHRPIYVRFAGTIALTAPSVAHQVALDISSEAKSQWVLEPPAYMLHVHDSVSGTVVTHTAYIGEFDGPYPFHDGDRLID